MQLTEEVAGGTNRARRRNKTQQCGAAKNRASLGSAGRAVGLQRVLERSLGRPGRPGKPGKRGATHDGRCAVRCGMRPVAAAGVSGGRGPCLFRAQGWPGGRWGSLGDAGGGRRWARSVRPSWPALHRGQATAAPSLQARKAAAGGWPQSCPSRLISRCPEADAPSALLQRRAASGPRAWPLRAPPVAAQPRQPGRPSRYASPATPTARPSPPEPARARQSPPSPPWPRPSPRIKESASASALHSSPSRRPARGHALKPIRKPARAPMSSRSHQRHIRFDRRATHESEQQQLALE